MEEGTGISPSERAFCIQWQRKKSIADFCDFAKLLNMNFQVRLVRARNGYIACDIVALERNDVVISKHFRHIRIYVTNHDSAGLKTKHRRAKVYDTRVFVAKTYARKLGVPKL